MDRLREILEEKLEEIAILLTEELYEGVSFFALSLCYFIFMVRLTDSVLRPIYMEQIGLYLDSAAMKKLVWIVYGANFGLFLLAGYRKRSLLNLLQTGLVPLMVCFGLQRLQAHFVIMWPVFLALSLAGVVCLFFFALDAVRRLKRMRHRKHRKNQVGPDRRKIRLVTRCLRRWRSALTVFLVAFCGIGLLIYAVDNGQTAAVSRNGEQVYEDGTLWDAHPEKLRPLKSENYNALSPGGRLEALQGIVDLEVLYFGIGPLNLTAEQIEDIGENGYFDGNRGIIVLNDRLLQDDVDRSTCLETVLHECYHAYELACVEAVDWEQVDTSLRMYRDVSKWRDDFLSYQSATGYSNEEEYSIYYNQSLEADARAYAAEWVIHYLDYIDAME